MKTQSAPAARLSAFGSLSGQRAAKIQQRRRMAGMAAGRGPQTLSTNRKANQRARSEKIFGRAGIQALHRSCSFANYEVSGPEQRQAYSMAKSYAQNFGGGGFASFVFSGAPGTGKNHLAAAIGNHLLAAGHSVLVVTIPDLMLRVRECYDGGQSESALLNDLCNVDLLVLDEVGIQRGSSGEKVIINQVIDRRLSSIGQLAS
ncbi:DNA replication protein dnaC [Leclercia adecarboxylata]|nr:DNA replication protein dnaC [Leclercia adecarboxylata]